MESTKKSDESAIDETKQSEVQITEEIEFSTDPKLFQAAMMLV